MAVCRSEPPAHCRSIWPNARAKRRWERCHSQQREEQCSCQYRQGNAAARHRHSPEALSAAASSRSTEARRSVQSHPGQGTFFSVEWTFKLILCDLLMPELDGLPLISVHRPPGRDAHANCGRTSVAKRSMAWSKPSIERLGKSQRKFCIPNAW
jgi:CheY-like chemotaxis protein